MKASATALYQPYAVLLVLLKVCTPKMYSMSFQKAEWRFLLGSPVTLPDSVNSSETGC